MTTWRLTWAVSIYQGPNPLALRRIPGLRGPALAREHVTDIRCGSVADPFLLKRDGLWYMFVEVVNTESDRGELAYATSPDAIAWTYEGVVLREAFHLSYPQIFEWDNQVFLVPETRQANAVRLYVADPFPLRWRLVTTLLTGRYADPTVARIGERWWMFVQRGLDELRLFSSVAIEGPWTEHPQSPVRAGNRSVTRPGGRMVAFDGRLFRFAQGAWPNYGADVRAIEIDRLTLTDYAEHEVPESPILQASLDGWNAMGMHHLDAVPVEPGRWIGAVDGAHLAL